MRVPRAALVLVSIALLVAAPASVNAADGSARRVSRGLDQAVAAGWITPAEATAYRGTLAAAVRDIASLPRARSRAVAAVLADVAALSGSYTSPRALTLFTMLQENASYFETNPVPTRRLDIVGESGVVYRYFSGHGFQFHPLANFGALNALTLRGDDGGAAILAQALIARGIPRAKGLAWEYSFRFSGSPPRWTSGMAQAVAAQAFARTYALTKDPSLLTAATRAFIPIQAGLVLQRPEGPWIRLYSFDREVVLNAQLQAGLSVGDYAEASGDVGAAAFATSLLNTAKVLLPRFDTGAWSLYSLGGPESPLEYQVYVNSLLAKLAQRTADPVWIAAASRFAQYVKQPPALAPGPPPPTLYPVPRDGFRDQAAISFTLSKLSTVTFRVGGRSATFQLARGRHVLIWRPDRRPPGTYAAELRARDLAGNQATVPLPPIVVAWDTRPPQVTAVVQGSMLTWRGADEGTPWLDLRVRLTQGTVKRTLALGRRPLSGSAALRVPSGSWSAVLVATNSAGRRTAVTLGTLTGA
jgi:D-glucuronyl C5-epimerase C-terminus